MRSLPLNLLFALAALPAAAQYGTFDANAVKDASTTTTLVVLDAGDSPYNRALMDAVKAHWTFTKSVDFITVNDLATQPLGTDKTYLVKTLRNDPEKYTGTFLTLMRGWKQKKGEVLEVTDNAIVNMPPSQDIAFLQIDPAGMAANGTAAFLNLYLKAMQDYLKQVSTGKITDKATADRLYAGRNRLVRDELDLWIAKEHLDKSLADAAAVKAEYTHKAQVMDLMQLNAAVAKGEGGVAVTDVLLTGEHKNKHCFKRVFKVSTGELMYLRDDAAIFGKKEGFIAEDLKTIERAR
ncbi:MAG: hypothetical protein IT228_05270 [Flavobacteriales bacterium]|nr:hypothetical protein [Flavobacteriales bacterium]MCC6576734.1 hypothetical protein [Flavobacteriales bacterium]NUQ15626.1 hypothetical protein [Flavobacteriales bacterium]